MKNKYKQFLIGCNTDKYNQLCFKHERKIAKKLKKKGFIKNIIEDKYFLNDGEFLMYLTKKGVKKAKALCKKEKENAHYKTSC
jgi:hypothetical protein